MGLRYDFSFRLARNANIVLQMIRLTIRATDESVPLIICKLMEERLAIGISTQPEPSEQLTRRDISDAFSNVLVT
jgi:AP-2 complex subunit alpha